MNLGHRDDVPPKVLEAIEKAMKERGMDRPVFAGDVPDGKLPPEVAEFQRLMADSVEQGHCFRCQRGYPGIYPPQDGEALDGDWAYIGRGGKPIGLECGDCPEGTENPMGVMELEIKVPMTILDALLGMFKSYFLDHLELPPGGPAHKSALYSFLMGADATMHLHQDKDEELREAIKEMRQKGWLPYGKYL